MENQETANNRPPAHEAQNANQENTSLASDGPITKNEGNGTSPDLNDTTKITNADDADQITNADDPIDEQEPQQEEETSQNYDSDQAALDLGLADGNLDADVPEEKK
jgi:hypothetical protein